MTDIAPNDRVTRRRVFYIPGYDPFPPRRYRELYRTESAEQAQISGYEISIAAKDRKTGGAFGWNVQAVIDDQPSTADVEVLVWSDIVQSSMTYSIPRTYLIMLQTAWIYISTGALWRLMRLRKGPVIAALYPIGMLLLQLLIAVGMAAYLFPQLSFVLQSFLGRAGSVLAFSICAMVCLGVLDLFRRKDGRFYAYYLMHDYSYSARLYGAHPPELEKRMAAFADTIAAAFDDDVQEVLVVGHSSGAHLAISILADLIRDGRLPADGPKLAFLSLGQVVPMLSFLPNAQRLRADLAYLSAQDRLTWVDITAPGDGCSFALCDPVAVTGVAPEGQRWPLVVSAAFTQTLKPETWKALRWRFFRLHFQYLCAFDNPGDYDYFRITAGPKTLAARYDGRQPSKSRITKPTSQYRSVL